MEIFILIIVILATISLFIYAYKLNLKLQNNKLIKNLEEYDKKEKAKQQKSKILGQKQNPRKINKKERTRMYHF
tara:strand:+ start:331 stop:552 length:222 start_codon:yes stop_codon:yes gene_type:complete